MPPKRSPKPLAERQGRKKKKNNYVYEYSFEREAMLNPEPRSDDDGDALTNACGQKGIPSYDTLNRTCFKDGATLDNYITEEYPILKVPTVCPRCSKPVPPPKNRMAWCYRYECRGNHGGKECSQSIYKGSFFEGARRGKESIMVFLHQWLIGATATAIELFTGWSSDKVHAWTLAVQDMITTVVINDQQVFGGPGIVVEIDESKFGKRKYNKGHRVEGAWVFGGVELTHERKFFAIVVPNRTKATLLPLIKKHIAKGSIIRSDQFSAYYNRHNGEGIADWLPEMDYTYENVNHSDKTCPTGPYVSQEGVHTNTIEGSWFAVKRSVPIRKRTTKQLQGCLFEFIWRRMNEGNLWNGLMRTLEEVRYECSDDLFVPRS